MGEVGRGRGRDGEAGTVFRHGLDRFGLEGALAEVHGDAADVDEGLYSFSVGTIYVDLVRECEKCGDYIINVVEAKMGGKRGNNLED